MKRNKQGQRPTMKDIAAKVVAKNLGSAGEALITSPDQPPAKEKSKNEMGIGDWVRCNRGQLRGAEGNVQGKKKVSELVTVIEVRQLNGNIIKLPRSHWEFAAFRGGMEAQAHAE